MTPWGHAARTPPGPWPPGADPWPPTSLLGRLAPSTRQMLLALGVRRRYRAGQVLMREGDTTTHAVLVRTGHVKITASTAEGGSALLAIRQAGDILGELAALRGTPRTATVTAAVPVTGNQIERPELLTFLRRSPETALAITSMLGDRLCMSNRRRLDISGASTKVRVARILVELAERFGRDTERGRLIDVGLPHHELAQLVGVTTVTVQRALSQLRRTGLIEVDYRRITIRHPQALQSLSSEAHPRGI